jgi:hypothetical protein
MPPRPDCWLLVALLALPGLALAEEVYLADRGPPVQGEVLSLDEATLQLQPPGGEVQRIPAGRVIEITFPGQLQEVDGESTVILWSGDRYRGQLSGGSRSTLRLTSRALGELTLRLTDVREVIRGSDTWQGASVAAGRDEDVAYLGGGDHLVGTVDRLGVDGVTISSEALGGAHTFPFEKLVRLTFADLGRPPLTESSLRRLLCFLVDGSQLSAGLSSYRSGRLSLVDERGAAHELGRASLARLVFLEGDFTYLSDLTPLEGDQDNTIPFPSVVSWPHRRDEAVDGGPLVACTGRRFARGLGVHSRSVLSYPLQESDGSPRPGRYFLATVGLDRTAHGKDADGSVVFRVRRAPLEAPAEAGEVLDETPVMRPDDGLVDLGPIDLGADRAGYKLILEVDHADILHVCDRALWGAARLVP